MAWSEPEKYTPAKTRYFWVFTNSDLTIAINQDISKLTCVSTLCRTPGVVFVNLCIFVLTSFKIGPFEALTIEGS